MNIWLPILPFLARGTVYRFIRKSVKLLVPLALGLYFLPKATVIFFAIGMIDVSRNRPLNLNLFKRYFLGNGVLTWFTSPINVLIDLLCFPFRNRGIFAIEELPPGHREEIEYVIDVFKQDSCILEQFKELDGSGERTMAFLKWYGNDGSGPIKLPELNRELRYVKTIGISAFKPGSATGFHFGPLRLTMRVLYSLNKIESDEAFIEVGDYRNVWKDEPLFIFDDTLMHRSVNDSDQYRYCIFMDILRPSYFSIVLNSFVAFLRVVLLRFNHIFYKHWKFLK